MVLWLLLCMIMVTAHAHFTCPEMAPHCNCLEDTAWWTVINDYLKLKIVNCSFNSLTEVPDLSSLQGKPFHRLLLNNNNISHINSNHFKGLKLKEINIRRNPLRKIPNDVFQEVKDELEILDMDSVRIKIDQGLPFLRGLSSLIVLDLGYNQVTKNKYKTFPSGIFIDFNLTSLRTLTLQALQMEKLAEGTFLGIEHIEQLDLSHNFLAEFPSEVRKLTKLKDLKLYSNEIQILENNTFDGMRNLHKLLIGVNEIDTIEVNAFHDLNDSIEEINLYHNPLYNVPTEAISNLGNLKKLSLVKTHLSSIPNGSFVGDHELKELHLDDNPGLVFEEGMFSGIEESLEVLFIRTLKLHELPLDALRRLKKLFYLDASDNAVRKIDKHFFSGLHKLSHIKLVWNKIKHIDHRAFKHLQKGVILNLHNNDISDISFILDVKECTFNQIDVSANSIPCDCTLERILNSGLVSWKVIGYCYVQSETEGVTWYNFEDETLMDHLWQNCNRTKPYASCMQSTSGAKIENTSNLMFISLVLIINLLLVL